jgi:hypothetical protein
MESLTSSSTSLSELEGISDRLIERMRDAGIDNVERILELGLDALKGIPGIGNKTADKIMEAARDLFEEVEIEVPEGIELPTAIQAVASEEGESEDEEASETDSEAAKESVPEQSSAPVEDVSGEKAVSEKSPETAEPAAAGDDK